MTVEQSRAALAGWGKHLSGRGLCPGTSGNVSVAVNDGWLCTPTGRALGELAPSDVAFIDKDGEIDARGPAPTKEWRMHLALYQTRPEVQAIVHLHSTYAVAVSCRADVSAESAIPPLTSYYAMNVRRLPLVPWQPPGDAALAEAVREYATLSPTLLLANHGPVVGASSLERAVNISEELEEAAKIWLVLHGIPTIELTAAQIERLPKP